MGAEKNDGSTGSTDTNAAATATNAAAVAAAANVDAATDANAAAVTDTGAAREGAEPTKPASAAPAKVDLSEMSTVEILRAKKEERQGRAKDSTTAKPNGSDAKPAEAQADKAAEAPGKVDLSSKSTNEGGFVDDDALVKSIDTGKPGWFDRLTAEQRGALERKHPETIRLANAGKAEAQRYVERAKQKTTSAAATESSKADKTQTDDKATKAETDADLSEAIDLLYDPKTKKQGLSKILSDPDAVELIDARVVAGVKSTLKQLGVDLDEQIALQPLSHAIELASAKYPQLKSDDTFFDEVDALLREDEETFDALMEQRNPRIIAVALREASATVVRSRAAKKPAPAEEVKPATAASATSTTVATTKQTIGAKERRDNLERTTIAAREQAGMKAGAAGSRTGTGGQGAEPESTVELLRRNKQGKEYRFIGTA